MRNRGKNKRNTLKNIILEHINNNLREYTLALLIFIIGVIAGVIFINNATEQQISEITTYLNNFLGQLKTEYKIDRAVLLKNTLISNLGLTIFIWFVGSTVIGIPIVYIITAYRGFCLSYTISSAVLVLGISKGIVFAISSVLLQNIIFIPCLIALAVSGTKMCKNILKDKRKQKIKIEITRQTLFCIIILLVLEISAFVETYISTGLLQICSKYI